MISTHLKFLRRLELYRAARLGDASIAAVASIPGLSHLVLHEAGNVTDRGIQQLMAGMAEKVDEGESLRFLELNR